MVLGEVGGEEVACEVATVEIGRRLLREQRPFTLLRRARHLQREVDGEHLALSATGGRCPHGVVDHPEDICCGAFDLARISSTSFDLSKGAAAALEETAMKRVSYAPRLNLLPSRLAGVTLDEATLRKELRQVGVPARMLIGANGEFDFGAEEVGVFLDVLGPAISMTGSAVSGARRTAAPRGPDTSLIVRRRAPNLLGDAPSVSGCSIMSPVIGRREVST